MAGPSPADPLGRSAVAFFEDLSLRTLDRVDEFYAADVRFEDPMVELDGRARLREYYGHIYRNDPSLRWEFPDVVGDPATSTRTLVWIMHMQADGLNGGRPIAVPGVSHLVFDAEGRCSYHRDYFDMGAFVYENVPLLRGVIGFVKRKLHGDF